MVCVDCSGRSEIGVLAVWNVSLDRLEKIARGIFVLSAIAVFVIALQDSRDFGFPGGVLGVFYGIMLFGAPVWCLPYVVFRFRQSGLDPKSYRGVGYLLAMLVGVSLSSMLCLVILTFATVVLKSLF